MAPKTQQRRSRLSSKTHAAAASARPRARKQQAEDGQLAASTIPLVRKQACVASLVSKGCDRAMQAYSDLAHKHRTALEETYQKHSANTKALGAALASLCSCAPPRCRRSGRRSRSRDRQKRTG